MGAQQRDGVDLFIPGDVPESSLRQKRTAEYKVQKLTMGVPDDGKAYNPANLGVGVPNKEANARRAIPLEKMETRKMEATSTVVSEEREFVEGELASIYVTDCTKNTTSVYNIKTGQSTIIPKVSSETTITYFGNLNRFKSDVTLTLQGTYCCHRILTSRTLRFTYYDMFLRRWGGYEDVLFYH